MIGSMDLLAPDNLVELQTTLKRATQQTKLLAGGTDLVIDLQKNRCRPDMIIDLSGVKELKITQVVNKQIHIGAMATFNEIKKVESIRKNALCLAEAAASIGSNQVRNLGTIGGNIGNASPASDIIPVLMALGAEIRVMDSAGQVEDKSLDEIVIGSGRTNLKCDQVIKEIIIPLFDDSYRSAFIKLGSRKTVTIAKLNLAMLTKYDHDSEIISDVRIALGAIGKKAFRDRRVEDVLNGQKVDRHLAQTFGEELSLTVQKAIPGRYSLPYKMKAIFGVAHDLWSKLFPEF